MDATLILRHPGTRQSAASLIGLFVGFLPVLERLRSRLDTREIGIGAVGARRAVGLLRGDFLPLGLFFSAAFLTLALALSLLL